MKLSKKNRVIANRNIRNRRRIMAATTGGLKIIVRLKGEVEIYEDSYENGEGAYVNAWDFDVRGTYDTFQDLINAIKNETYCFTNQPSNYVFLDGTIQTDAIVDEESEEPSDRQLEAWKRGEYELYAARLVLPIEVGAESHEMTEEEAEMFGISVY